MLPKQLPACFNSCLCYPDSGLFSQSTIQEGLLRRSHLSVLALPFFAILKHARTESWSPGSRAHQHGGTKSDRSDRVFV